MRTDLREMSEGTGIAGSRRGRSAMSRLAANENSVGLEPLAVDAAFADETMPMQEDRGSRRDASHGGGGAAAPAPEPMTADDQLLRSLSAQLELLNQQQHEIRRLLDQAGRRRVDRIAN
jgi:hypothetical protein